MAAKIILKRGFKTKAEEWAKHYRGCLKIHPCAPLCAFKLAEHLEIPIYGATEFPKLPSEINLLSGANGKDCKWSALTMPTNAGNRIIIYNSFHSLARQQSDLMHELAHIICKHERLKAKYDFEIPFGMRNIEEEEQEEEAKWLGSTLQLATPCLLWARKRNMATQEIAAYFNASFEMVIYRMNITGITKRYHHQI